MTTATANLISRIFAARDRFETHFDPCRTCGTGGRLCAEGSRLHSAYATLRNTLNR